MRVSVISKENKKYFCFMRGLSGAAGSPGYFIDNRLYVENVRVNMLLLRSGNGKMLVAEFYCTDIDVVV